MKDVHEKPLQQLKFPEKPLELKFHFIFLTLCSILVASIVTYSSSALTGFSYFLARVVSIGLFFAAVVIFCWISPPKADCPARKPEPSSSTMSPVIHNLDARKPADAQRGEGNTQTGGGGHNPQVQGNISAGTEGNINLGFQDKKVWPKDNKDKKVCLKDNKDSPQDNKGNTQIGGGGHNPQVQGNISAGTGGNINLGLQDKKVYPKDNKDSPQDNKDSPQDNKGKKGNTQIGGGGHNPQVQGDINAGSGGNINLGLQG